MTNPTPSRQTFPWALAIFPLLELCFFGGSLLTRPHSIWAAAGLLLLASLSLSFSIHIFFHECVHYRSHYPALFNWIASSIMGLPFDGYRIHHYNHHEFENAAPDFSCTWREQGGTRHPYPLMAYVLGWPRQLLRGVCCKTPFGVNPDHANQIKQHIPSQKRALLITFIVAAYAGWDVLIGYLLLTYLGWAFTALHNFGQHPPVEGVTSSSYDSALYNQLFFNNGLHWEHHHYPTLAWCELTPDQDSPRIAYPHPLYAFLAMRPDLKH